MIPLFTHNDDESFNRIEAVIKKSALVHNYKVIQKLCPNQKILPMIKANAYGHGDIWTAKTLAPLPHLYGLGVATLNEAITIRKQVSKKTNIIVFSGALPWSEEIGQACYRYQLTPVICTFNDWRKFSSSSWFKKINYKLKFNTGMNRLGIDVCMSSNIIQKLEKNRKYLPSAVITHLAESESPNSAISLKQKKTWKELTKQFKNKFPSLCFHFANSGAIWNSKSWGVDSSSQIIRPGISLYGIRPWQKASRKNLIPVMTFRAKVIAKRKLIAGEKIGYGASFKVKKPTHTAILSVGYEDGLHKALSNKGHVWLKNKPQPILGAISMDMSCIQCTPQTKLNDWAELFGPHVDHWHQALLLKTTPYELLTSVSNRVKRKYV